MPDSGRDDNDRREGGPVYIIAGPPREEGGFDWETRNASLAYWFWTIGFGVFENESGELYGVLPPIHPLEEKEEEHDGDEDKGEVT